jgi:hypothetical protein
MVERRSWRVWLMILGSFLVTTQFSCVGDSVATRKVIERKLLELSSDLSVLMAIER